MKIYASSCKEQRFMTRQKLFIFKQAAMFLLLKTSKARALHVRIKLSNLLSFQESN